MKKYPLAYTPFDQITSESFFIGPKPPPQHHITHWVPRREDIVMIANAAKHVSSNPTILDIGCGNGFLSYLLAREGVNVVGIDPDESHIVKSPYKHDNLELIAGGVERMSQYDADVIFNSWMPLGVDITPQIVAQNAPMIVYAGEYGGATGIAGLSYRPGPMYRIRCGWEGLSIVDAYLWDMRKRLSNITQIQVRRDVSLPLSAIIAQNVEPYAWEKGVRLPGICIEE